MKKILVTGGAGYIGSVAVKKLIEKDFSVFVIDNLSKGKKELVDKKAKLYVVDLLDIENLEKIFQENQFDVVMHFAAQKSVEESMEDAVKYSQNITGTINLLNCMVKYKVPKIIFSSSAAVYGIPKNAQKPITENCPVNPINFYGYTKLAMENIMFWYNKVHNIKYIALRYFNVAGDGGFSYIDPDAKNIFPIIMEVLCKQRDELVIFGNDYDTIDGTCVRDYIHINDLIDAHILAIASNYIGYINLGTKTGFSVEQLTKKFKKISTQEFKVKYGKRREGDPAMLVADNQKAKEHLNWLPKLSLEDMITSTLKTYINFDDIYER